MRKFSLCVALVLLSTVSIQAQSFTFGGRYSNYKTGIDVGPLSVDTNRTGSLGLLGNFRSGGFVLSGQWDHDLENGISVLDFLPIDVGNYKRDRVEIAAGYSVVPALDLMVGFRNDNVKLDTIGIGGFSFGQKFDNQMGMAGIRLHSPSIRPVGFYVDGRGYFGSAKFDIDHFGVNSDTNGYKAEAGVIFPLGLSGWTVTPGFEYEDIRSDRYDVKFTTNRFLLNFEYNFGR